MSVQQQIVIIGPGSIHDIVYYKLRMRVRMWQYPDCLMLKFTIKLISDAGYQGEISSASSASHQPEVFAGVVKRGLVQLVSAKPTDVHKYLSEFTVSGEITVTAHEKTDHSPQMPCLDCLFLAGLAGFSIGLSVAQLQAFLSVKLEVIILLF